MEDLWKEYEEEYEIELGFKMRRNIEIIQYKLMKVEIVRAVLLWTLIGREINTTGNNLI